MPLNLNLPLQSVTLCGCVDIRQVNYTTIQPIYSSALDGGLETI